MSEQGTVPVLSEKRRASIKRANEARSAKAKERRDRKTAAARVTENLDLDPHPGQLTLLKKGDPKFHYRWLRIAGHQAELNIEQKKYRGYEVIASTTNDPVGPQRRGDLVLGRCLKTAAATYRDNVSRRSNAAVEAAERAAHMQLRRQGLRTFEGDKEGRDREPDLGNRLDRIRTAEQAGIDPDRVVGI